MNKKELMSAWEAFIKNNDFKLNPDEELVNMLMTGLLANEKECGVKLCPCRIRDGTKKGDLELICPCNFKAHETWKTEGRCWCGLFVKR
ncbi:ferredoxin-thioredoxin reductase catalytic domain-containing protein [Chloroflexota bacterium]